MLYIDEKLWKTRNGDYNDVRVKDLMTYFSRFAKLRIVVMAFNYSFEGNQLWHQRDAMGHSYLHAPFDADHTYTCIWVRRQDGYMDSSTPGNICSQQLVGIDPVTLDFTGMFLYGSSVRSHPKLFEQVRFGKMRKTSYSVLQVRWPAGTTHLWIPSSLLNRAIHIHTPISLYTRLNIWLDAVGNESDDWWLGLLGLRSVLLLK